MLRSTLGKYLMRQNLFLILTCLASGTGLYLMSDMFDRLDNFVEAGLGLKTILFYFMVKTPLILSQIMPAVFLLAMVIQLSLMARSRELLALRSGGVSLGRLSRFFIPYAVAWCIIQLLFSQFVGVYGEQAASRIWTHQVSENIATERVYQNVWFREGNTIVEMRSCIPGKGTGRDVTVYEMSEDRESIQRIVRAKRVEAKPGNWLFFGVEELKPESFIYLTHDQYTMDLQQDMSTFLHIDPNQDPASLPMWDLAVAIDRLDAAGSNVERLRTAWHMKWAYAFSILAMGLVALALVTRSENIYLNIALSLVLTFAYYAVFMVGVTLGQKGILPPLVGAWLGNIVFYTLPGLWLLWLARPSDR